MMTIVALRLEYGIWPRDFDALVLAILHGPLPSIRQKFVKLFQNQPRGRAEQMQVVIIIETTWFQTSQLTQT